jgi:cellulose synthase/poly-beta-1,6-N-acetylglucosamine synthase-like glycosyltransferase
MKLSVLMPVYNERTVVEQCISQVLTAPLPDNMDLELVIVDDCSTDGTFAILERVATAFSQIRFTVRSEIAAREQQSATRLSMLRAIFHSSRTPTWNTTLRLPTVGAPAAGWPRRRCLWLPLHGRQADTRASLLALGD